MRTGAYPSPPTVLRDKPITGAAIDAFDIEPLPAPHPLRSLPTRCSRTHRLRDRRPYRTFCQDSVEDIAAFRAGNSPSGNDLSRGARVVAEGESAQGGPGTRPCPYPSIRSGLEMMRKVSGNPPGKRAFGGA